MIGRMARLLGRVDSIIFANKRQNVMISLVAGRGPEALQGASLQHPRQIWAPRRTLIAPIAGEFFRTVGGDFVGPIDELCGHGHDF